MFETFFHRKIHGREEAFIFTKTILHLFSTMKHFDGGGEGDAKLIQLRGVQQIIQLTLEEGKN